MNFKAFYGLSCNPFDKHSLKISDSFESADQRSMMNRLFYLKDVRGIGVFTASPGMGKSYCLQQFEASLNKNLYDMKYICLSTVSVGEFYKQLCDRLGLEAKGGKTVMFKAIQDRIHYLYKEKKQPLILAVDEAQYLLSKSLSTRLCASASPCTTPFRALGRTRSLPISGIRSVSQEELTP